MTAQSLVLEARQYFSSESHIDSIISSIERLVADKDWENVPDTDGEYGYESWVELSYGQPGDLEPEPVVVFALAPTRLGALLQKPIDTCKDDG